MAIDSELMEFEDILSEVGAYGPYQKHLVFFLLVPSLCLVPFFSMNIFFMLSVPDHWCFIPEIASSNLSLQQQKLLSPQTNPSCLMHDLNYTEYVNSKSFTIFNNSQTGPCVHGWQYDNSQYEYTAASQWNLVCDDGHYVSFVIMMQYIGSIIGNPFNGFLSDRFGRKVVYVAILLLAAVTEVASVLVKDFMAFTVIRAINGIVFPAIYQLPFVTLLEIVSPEKRAFINGVQSCCWTLGLCLLPAVAYLSRSWVALSLITASMTLFLLFFWSFIPESPRWLVSRGRCEEAFVIMKKISKKNGKAINPSILLTKLQALDEKCKEEKLNGLKHSATDILKVPHMRQLFAFISICWTASFLAYEGLQLNVYNLTGNEFLNFFLLAVMEVPGNLASWLLMQRFGRRFTLIISFTLTGLVCILSVIEYPYSDVAISIIGKFLAAITSMATYQRSSELFPTVVRCLGLSMCSMVATIITLCVPYIVYLGIYGKSIPFLTIGICCLLAGILSAFLPETLNKNLPQTINDAKDFGKDQKFFSFNRQKPQDRRDRQIHILLSEIKPANGIDDEENILLDSDLPAGKITILPKNLEHEEVNRKSNKMLSKNPDLKEETNSTINATLAKGLPQDSPLTQSL